jgi:hypothetical protein
LFVLLRTGKFLRNIKQSFAKQKFVHSQGYSTEKGKMKFDKIIFCAIAFILPFKNKNAIFS